MRQPISDRLKGMIYGDLHVGIVVKIVRVKFVELSYKAVANQYILR